MDKISIPRIVNDIFLEREIMSKIQIKSVAYKVDGETIREMKNVEINVFDNFKENESTYSGELLSAWFSNSQSPTVHMQSRIRDWMEEQEKDGAEVHSEQDIRKLAREFKLPMPGAGNVYADAPQDVLDALKRRKADDVLLAIYRETKKSASKS